MMISCLASLVRASTHEDPSRDHQLDVGAGVPTATNSTRSPSSTPPRCLLPPNLASVKGAMAV
jgi:hypothetical protein